MRDVDELFAALAKSDFRRRFRLAGRDRDYALARGLEELRDHARRIVGERLAPAVIPNDGKQTPMRGHPVFVAQHATATCCRGCLAKWHGIVAGHALTEAEVGRVLDVVTRWLAGQGVGAGSQGRLF